MRTVLIGCTWLAVLVGEAFPAETRGLVPEIAHVFPDFPCEGPRIITGENFEPGRTEVLIWEPPAVAKAEDLLQSVGDDELPLPAAPPAEARRAEVWDVEKQVIVASLGPAIVWIKTPAGVSQPYAIDLPRPCWMNPEQARPKQIVQVFGFGLYAPYREARIALRGAGRTISARRHHEARAYRDAGPAFFFEVPPDTAPGKYSVFLHNGFGGTLGWRKAGMLEVTAPAPIAERLLSVKDFGARGDDEDDDFDAIRKAFTAAQAALTEGVQPVVYFPAGKWRTSTTLQLPAGVWLRGASRDLTVIEGCGESGPHGHPTAVLHLASHTRVEGLTLQGMTWQGPEHDWPCLICAPPPVEDITVQSIRAQAGDYRASQPHWPYWAGGFSVGGRFIRLLDSEIFGACGLSGYRAECIGNTIHGGGNNDSVSFAAGDLVEAIIDCNRLVDAPTRFMVSPLRHCLIRFNEVHASHRGTYSNSEETFLVHGGGQKDIGHPTAVTPTTLTDRARQWKSGQRQNHVVLITAGRGLGQFRYVVDNTVDTLQLDRPWRVVPDATSEYVVGQFFAESHWYGNQNNTPGRTSLWLEQIGNVVSHHRDVFGGGLDIWGTDQTDQLKAADPKADWEARSGFHPSWFNLIDNSWFDGSRVLLWTAAQRHNLVQGPPMFGNLIVRNKVRQPHATRTTFDWNFHTDGGILVGNRSSRDMSKLEEQRIAVSHTVVYSNQVAYTSRGIAVADTARKTFLLSNEFEQVDRPLLDWGAKTLQRCNRVYDVDETGEHITPLPDRSSERDMQPWSPPSAAIRIRVVPFRLLIRKGWMAGGLALFGKGSMK